MAVVTAIEPPGFGTTWATAPDDGTKVKAMHLRELAELAVTNDLSLHNRVAELNPEVFTAGEDSSTRIWGTLTPTANEAHVDVAGCEVGEVLVISGSAHCSINAEGGSGASTSGGAVYLYRTQNLGVGAAAAVVGNRRGISQNPNTGTLSVNMAFTGAVVISAAGTCRVELRGEVNTFGDEIRLIDWSIVVERKRPE